MTIMPGSAHHFYFLLLPLEIQNMIWHLTYYPRLISLEIEAYSFREERAAVSWHKVIQALPNSSIGVDPNRPKSARFTITGSPSHVALQVSRRSRDNILGHGYRPWIIQNREGFTKIFHWNPEIDTVVFPDNPCETLRRDTVRYLDRDDVPKHLRPQVPGFPKANYHYWLRLFALQHPEEAALAEKVAILSTLVERGTTEYNWVARKIGNFTGLKELVVVIDQEEEGKKVTELISENQAFVRFGLWNIPSDIEEGLARWKPWNREKVGHEVKVPKVRVVSCLDEIFRGESLQIALRCNPCEYFGLG